MKKLLTLFLLFPLFCNAGLFYVSPTGTGTGTLASPFGLQAALNQPSSVHAGDTIYIQAGTYTGTFTSSLTGTLSNPIIVKNVGRVILDGTRTGQTIKDIPTLLINGAYTWYLGLEITNSDPTSRTGSFSGTDRRGTGLNVFGIGVKVINCIIYDNGQGLNAWTPAVNSEYYGNIIYNNGWSSPSGFTGHGIYTQNNTGTKFFSDNIILNNFGYGWHVYGSDQAQLNNFTFEGNVCFNDLWLMGGGTPLKNLKLVSNYSYNDEPEFGYLSPLNDTLTLTNNFFGSKINIKWFKNVVATGNTIFRYTNPVSPISLTFAGPPNITTWAFNNNTYYWSNSSPTSQQYFFWRNALISNPDAPGGAGNIFFPEWQTKGQDRTVNFKLFPLVGGKLVLSGKNIFIRPNKYDPNKFTIIIYNWDKSATVNVGAILNPGDQYELHNVQNYFGDVITGVSTGDSLVIPMTGHTVAKPLGYATELGPNTFPEFGVFELIRKPSIGSNPQIDSLIAVVQSMQAQITGLQAAINSTNSSSVAGINNLTGQLNTALGRISALEAQISTIGNLNTQLTALEAALTVLQNKVANLKATTTIQ